MNFYKHHIGDYEAATAHLTWLEDTAYTRLMRLYYRREQPIPADVAQACRLVRAQSKDERQAVQTVLEEFFELRDDGWHNRRCDEEIEVAQAKAQRNRETGLKGGRPPKSASDGNQGGRNEPLKPKPRNNPDGFQEKTQTVISGNPDETLARLQTPDSRLQKEERERTDVAPLRASAVDLAVIGRTVGVECAAHQPQMLALAEQGISAATFEAACLDAKQKLPGKRIPINYVIAILEDWAGKAASMRVIGSAPPPARQPVLSAAAQAAARATAPRRATTTEPEVLDASDRVVRIG